MSVAIDLSRNPKQFQFFLEIMKSCAGLNNYRKFVYGGAIRGGKTFVSLASLIRLANRYEGSKWHIIRQDFPALQGTTIPSFEKIIRGSSNWNWNRDKSNYFAYNKHDSKIFFKGENLKQDPELNDFLGLETNGVFLEQLEEIGQKTWDISISRTGSWYIDPMPPALTISTLNPTQNWPKEFLYAPYMEGILPADTFFQTATPSDNPFVTQDQWSNWRSMDERYQKKFIEGDWTDFDATDNRFAYCFDKKVHVGKTELVRGREVYLSFDFNHDPISCGVYQHSGTNIRCIEQIKLGNSNIYDLCDRILATYGGCMFLVTGDATGRATSALVKDSINYYTIIKSKLNLSINQLKVPNINPTLEENRVLVNYVLKNCQVSIDPDNAEGLIYDLQHVRVLPDGSIDKTNRKDPTKQSDSLDGWRYYLNSFHRHLMKF